jgi:threonine dehydratase
MSLEIEEILAARARIADKVHRTPVMTSESLDRVGGARFFFKCENLQRTGSFKARGATNAVFSLTDNAATYGVVTHSSGNHAAALARAAKLRGIQAYVVIPNNAPKVKVAATRRYGANVIFCEPTLEARQRTAQEVIERTGATFIHPYDDFRVIAGQGTVVLELLEDVPDLDVILAPVGGGGLLSGVAVAAQASKPTVRVIGVEPAQADDAARSLKAGHIIPSTNPKTNADGLLTSLSEKTFAEIQKHVDDIVTVSEEGIISAMRLIWEVVKLVVEPSGAVSYAAIVEERVDTKEKHVGIVLSGGNLDLETLPW